MSQTALITGASSGIGRALALELARHGHEVVLVSRNAADLEAVALDCRKAGDSRAEIFPADLTDPNATKAIVEFLRGKGLTVNILVNNAGFGVHGSFAASDLAKERDLVQVQIGAMLDLTKAFLPTMIARKTGQILNVASVYAFHPVPQQAVYAASKGFMLAFSESLRDELKGTGVTVTVLAPGITQSAFRKRMGKEKADRVRGMPADEVARYAYHALRMGSFLAVPGMLNQVYVALARIAPRAWMSGLIRWINHKRGMQT